MEDHSMCKPTLKPFKHFDPEADCKALYAAMKGLGTDEQEIIDVLAYRTADQRVKLVGKYKAMYGKDLVSHLKSELSGRFEDVVVAMCCTLDELDARELHHAIKGAGTDEDMLIQILCSRDTHRVKSIKEAYSRLFVGCDLESDIAGDTSGDFRNVLVSLVQGKRESDHKVDRSVVKQDAQALYEAGENRIGTDEAVFNQILASRSEEHVCAVIKEYESIAGQSFEESLRSELSGNTLKTFLAITRCFGNKQKYFADLLKTSMAGAGTSDRMLIHIIVSRCEIDLGCIKEKFQLENGKSLAEWIADDISGDYKRMILALVGN